MHLTAKLLEQARAIMSNPATFGTVAAGLCMQILDDEECIHWDPAVLDQALTETLGEAHVHADVLQRVHAVSALLLSDGFFADPVVFHAVCSTLLEPDSDPANIVAPPEPLELAWSCAEASALLGDVYSAERFSPAVRRYCGVALAYSNLSVPPAALKFADMPGERYPDAQRYGDETLLASWMDAQESEAAQIDEAVLELLGAMREQLSLLSPFSADEAPFRRLRPSA